MSETYRNKIIKLAKKNLSANLVLYHNTSIPAQEHLVIGKPDSNIYRISYLLLDGKILIITGDCGSSIFRFSSSVTLREIAKMVKDEEYSYLVSKCEASPEGKCFKVWTEEWAIEFLTGFIAALRNERNESEESEAELDKKIEESDLWESLSFFSDWCNWLETYGQDVFGSGWYELGNVGMFYAPEFFYQLLGLDLAFSSFKGITEDTIKV